MPGSAEPDAGDQPDRLRSPEAQQPAKTQPPDQAGMPVSRRVALAAGGVVLVGAAAVAVTRLTGERSTTPTTTSTGPHLAADGRTDDTASLTRLAEAARQRHEPLILPAATILVAGWQVPPGLVVRGAGRSTILKLHPQAKDPYVPVIDLDGTHDVTLEDLAVDGNRTQFASVRTEWKHGIRIVDATTITLNRLTIADCMGDGIYIGRGIVGGSDGQVRSLRVTSVTVSGSYRNNVSIIDLTDGEFTDCVFTLAKGTSPHAGVDIEPNASPDTVRDVRFTRCAFTDNAGSGIAVVFGADAVQGPITFDACRATGNTDGLIVSGTSALALTACALDANKRFGLVVRPGRTSGLRLSGGSLSRNGQHGLYCRPGPYTPKGETAAIPSQVIHTRLDGVRVQDNGTTAPGTYSGLFFDAEPPIRTVPAVVDGLVLSGCVIGNTTTANQRAGLFAGLGVAHLEVRGTDLRGNAVTAAVLRDDPATRTIATSPGLSDASGAL